MPRIDELPQIDVSEPQRDDAARRRHRTSSASHKLAAAASDADTVNGTRAPK